MEVDLTPIGARMRPGHPMHELARRVVGLDDVIGPGVTRLREAPDAGVGRVGVAEPAIEIGCSRHHLAARWS